MAVVKKILCPVDFSETSSQAFERGLEFARDMHAELILLHVIGEVPLLSAYTGVPETQMLGEVEHYAAQQLDEMLVRRATQGVAVRRRVARAAERGGSADYAILSVAEEEGADLIVMGKHGRGRLDYLFFGSVTDRVIRRAQIPVVVVPSPPPA